MWSRALWLEEGNNNTKCFHHFANHRKVINTIWELKKIIGTSLNSQDMLLKEGHEFFKSLYLEPNHASIDDQLRVLKCFPSIVIDTQKSELDRLITLKELKEVMSYFKKSKSLGRDGWPIELFL